MKKIYNKKNKDHHPLTNSHPRQKKKEQKVIKLKRRKKMTVASHCNFHPHIPAIWDKPKLTHTYHNTIHPTSWNTSIPFQFFLSQSRQATCTFPFWKPLLLPLSLQYPLHSIYPNFTGRSQQLLHWPRIID